MVVTLRLTGSILDTVSSSPLVTHTDPSPTAMPLGKSGSALPGPTSYGGIGCPMVTEATILPEAGSIFTTVWAGAVAAPGVAGGAAGLLFLDRATRVRMTARTTTAPAPARAVRRR